MSTYNPLARADELIAQHCDCHKSNPEAAVKALDKGRALAVVTWHRLLRERASNPQASQAERDAAAATLAAEGVTL